MVSSYMPSSNNVKSSRSHVQTILLITEKTCQQLPRVQKFAFFFFPISSVHIRHSFSINSAPSSVPPSTTIKLPRFFKKSHGENEREAISISQLSVGAVKNLSFPPSHRLLHSSSTMSSQAAQTKGVAEQDGFSNSFLHLFDEKWFFNNVLSGLRIILSHGGLNDGGLATSKLYVQEPVTEEPEKLEKTASPFALQLTTSTPSIQPLALQLVKEEPELSVGRKLAYSSSPLEAPPQQSILSPSKSMGRKRPQRAEILLQWFANARLAMAWEASYRKEFQSKKWRSLGDLETMELQGFKDLGFIFPGDQRKGKEEDGRIYLPETWFTQKSVPVMVLRQVRCRSGEEMKEQLRFWARAVACNVWGR